jgi:hypothetical protein
MAALRRLVASAMTDELQQACTQQQSDQDQTGSMQAVANSTCDFA